MNYNNSMLMTTDKEKESMRKYIKRKRAEKKAEGRVGFTWQIKPEWRLGATEYFKKKELECQQIENKKTTLIQ